MPPVDTRGRSLSSHLRATPITCTPEGPGDLTPPTANKTEEKRKDLGSTANTTAPEATSVDSVSKLLPNVQKQGYQITAGAKIQPNAGDQLIVCEPPQKGKGDCVMKLPLAAVPRSHKLSGSRGRTLGLSHFGRSAFQNQLHWAEAAGVSRRVPPGGAETGRVHFHGSFSFY